MGSLGAMRARSFSKDRYFQGDVEDVDKLVPEGHRGTRALQGPARAAPAPAGRRPAPGDGLLRRADDRGAEERRSSSASPAAGLRESHPHDVVITKDAPNYRRG